MESVSNNALEAARAKLAEAEAKREALLLRHIANGVNIASRTVEIDEGVVIAPGATILAGTILRGKTVIGAGNFVIMLLLYRPLRTALQTAKRQIRL